MKTLIYKGINNVNVASVGNPKIEKADDIVIKVTSTAICGSDLHLVHGMVPNMPKGFILGHETIGGVKKGDVVVILGCGPIGLTAIKWAILAGAKRVIAVDCVGYRLEHARKYNGVETINIDNYDDTGEYINEITSGGADVVLDCVGVDGKMSTLEKIETALKLQGGSKSAIEIATQAVRKGGTVVLVGVYGTRYNMFPLGDFFAKNITLKMGQCPVHAYVDSILTMIKEKRIDPTDIITHKLPLDQGSHAYEIFDRKEDNCIKVILKP